MYKEDYISAPTREDYNKHKGDIKPDALVFIEDEEVLVTPFKEYQLGASGGDKPGLFVDLWDKACGEWGKYDPENAPDASTPFYLNELWLSYEEAIEVYQNWLSMGGRLLKPFEKKALFSCYKFITNIPIEKYALQETAHSELLAIQNLVDFSTIINLRIWSPRGINDKIRVDAKQINRPFFRSPTLTKWLDLIELNDNDKNTNANTITLGVTSFGNRPSQLEVFYISKLNSNLEIADHGKIGISTLRYIVDNRLASTSSYYNAITITVHQEIYDALTGNAAYPFNGGTREEWGQLLEDAIAHDISFATV